MEVEKAVEHSSDTYKARLERITEIKNRETELLKLQQAEFIRHGQETTQQRKERLEQETKNNRYKWGPGWVTQTNYEEERPDAYLESEHRQWIGDKETQPLTRVCRTCTVRALTYEKEEYVPQSSYAECRPCGQLRTDGMLANTAIASSSSSE